MSSTQINRNYVNAIVLCIEISQQTPDS